MWMRNQRSDRGRRLGFQEDLSIKSIIRGVKAAAVFARSPEEKFGKALGELRKRSEMRDQRSLAHGAVKWQDGSGISQDAMG